ncbi:serine protease FAM111A-like [Sardina pilchardus]|uniref:serine protease FAM111A-like n=1 Tax=Sardina pilchardus TaxID=27697 RepID=UPI002E103C18
MFCHHGACFVDKTKELFRNNAAKRFKYLCVYGEKGVTVEEALRRDGRFIDDLGNYSLSNNENPKCLTERAQMVVSLNQKKFKICLPKRRSGEQNSEEKNAGNPSSNSHNMRKARSVTDVAHQSGVSVKTAVEKSVNTAEIYELLRQQFPDLKEWMESRYPGESYQKALALRKENFGKVQQSFSEVHRVRKLLKLGESVCKIVTGFCSGTGFVLFDRFILTNAHLFTDHVEGKELEEDIEVFVLFNYEEPEPNTNFYYFTGVKTFVDIDFELDYAILELNPEGQKSNQQTNTNNIKVPPGLLKKFGPSPQNGEACIIGHPAGEVKKMDPTFIIEKEERAKAVNGHLEQYKDTLFILLSISQSLKDKGIEDIMMGGHDAEKCVTYNTFMYHGSSGSPVFDALGKVFGLHTAGYTYEFANLKGNVIEYARPLLTIFERFVRNLKESENEDLLERVVEAAKGNKYLEDILKVETADLDDPMELG